MINIAALVCGLGVMGMQAGPIAPEKAPADKPAEKAAQLALPRLPASPKLTKVAAAEAKPEALTPEALVEAARAGAAKLVAMQEGAGGAEWPYEGVYRVGGQIPVGYRVGGTGIGVLALITTPGYEQDEARVASVERAVGFLIAVRTSPLLGVEEYDGSYDVRAWGSIYALHALCELEARKLTPAKLAKEAREAAVWYCRTLQAQAMPKTGGWNYARPEGVKTVGSPSSFMTATALQALFAAKAVGLEVDAAVVEQGLSVLEKSRGVTSGEVVYAGAARPGADAGKGVPGAMGRMCAVEATLALAGRGEAKGLERAVDAFVEHWAELDKRRMMPGTHVAPYGVAPYYFMFAHRYAAQAVELLPEADRAARRARINALLFSVRGAEGTWNDRVFARSANFGTGFALLALAEPGVKERARWAGK